MAISDQLTLLNNTKTAIRTAINNKGGSVGASDTFASYATAIDNLPSGGDNSTLIDLIEGDITSINIPSGTTRIGESAFSNISTLTSATIPNTVTYIGQSAFANCLNLANITIPSSVTTFNTYSFYNCISLTSVTIPNGVTTIPSSCFFGGGFSNISFPISVTRIETQAFKGSKLTTLSIPDTITFIGNSVFEACSQLTSVVIGTGITNMSNAVFYNCTALQSVVIKATNPPTQTNAFNNTGNCPLFVPASSLDTYKAASGWSTYASRIYPIQQVATVDGNPVYNYDIGNTSSTTILSTEMDKLPAGTSIEFAEGITGMGGEITGYTTVTLPSTFTSFNDQEMIGSSVTTLTMKSTTPPTAERSKFGGSGLTAIFVPTESVDTYKAASGWSTFASIIQAIPTE